jgi:ParB family chromosome partitioning protein
LGKGLDALFRVPEEEILSPVPAGDLKIPLNKLKPNPDQPRKYFGEDELNELAHSIREHGIIEPIIAMEAGDGTYTVIAGERRCRAAQIAGLSEVPVLLRTYAPEALLEIALIENIQRMDLNPIEEAQAYKKLMEITGLSQDSVAVKVGKNRSTVANAVRLLRLPPEVRKSIEQGEISPGHARAILQVAKAEDRDTLFREIREVSLSVREAERRAGELNDGAGDALSDDHKGRRPKTAKGPGPVRDAEITDMEGKLIERFGTKVSITGDLEKGSIHIDYYSMDDLDRLYDIILGS